MKGERGRIQATGILNVNIIKVDDDAFEWLETDNFSLANLARTIGIDINHKAKATVTIEIAKGPCEILDSKILVIGTIKSYEETIAQSCSDLEEKLKRQRSTYETFHLHPQVV
jgi:hypothetical protein